jgi:hypothetical protein
MEIIKHLKLNLFFITYTQKVFTFSKKWNNVYSCALFDTIVSYKIICLFY